MEASILRRLLLSDPSLTSLFLQGTSTNWIRAAGVEEFAKALSANSSLQTLNLGYNHIGAAGAVALAEALSTNSALLVLHLGHNQIGDAGAAALAGALSTNSTLTSLSLDDNFIGAEGAAALVEGLSANSTLTSITLDNNSGIGDAGVAAVVKALNSFSFDKPAVLPILFKPPSPINPAPENAPFLLDEESIQAIKNSPKGVDGLNIKQLKALIRQRNCGRGPRVLLTGKRDELLERVHSFLFPNTQSVFHPSPTHFVTGAQKRRLEDPILPAPKRLVPLVIPTGAPLSEVHANSTLLTGASTPTTHDTPTEHSFGPTPSDKEKESNELSAFVSSLQICPSAWKTVYDGIHTGFNANTLTQLLCKGYIPFYLCKEGGGESTQDWNSYHRIFEELPSQFTSMRHDYQQLKETISNQEKQLQLLQQSMAEHKKQLKEVEDYLALSRGMEPILPCIIHFTKELSAIEKDLSSSVLECIKKDPCSFVASGEEGIPLSLVFNSVGLSPETISSLSLYDGEDFLNSHPIEICKNHQIEDFVQKKEIFYLHNMLGLQCVPYATHECPICDCTNAQEIAYLLEEHKKTDFISSAILLEPAPIPITGPRFLFLNYCDIKTYFISDLTPKQFLDFKKETLQYFLKIHNDPSKSKK